MSLLEARQISTGYGVAQALWDVDVEVEEGETVALVGSNGAGKTTLLRVLSGILPAWSGQVHLDGTDLTRAEPDECVQRGISHVPEGRQLFAGMTVEENLRMGAYARRDGPKAVQKDLDWVYSLFPEVAERRRQLAGTLSGGQQQMVAIGRGLMAAPRLLLIDELSLGLAPVIVDRLIDGLKQVREEKRLGMLVVEQDIEVALTLAARGYVLETGRVVRQGARDELLGDESIREAYLGI